MIAIRNNQSEYTSKRSTTVLVAEDREELIREISMLKEKLSQKDELVERNERELRRLRGERLGVEKSLEKRYTTTGKRDNIEEMRIENDNLLQIIQKKDGIERELRRSIQTLQREADNSKLRSPDGLSEYTLTHITPSRSNLRSAGGSDIGQYSDMK